VVEEEGTFRPTELGMKLIELLEDVDERFTALM
jgi:DNA topoisomerase IA